MSKIQLKCFSFVLAAFICCNAALSQNTTNTTLQELLQQAEKNYPSIVAKKAQMKASEAAIAIQQNTIVPSLDAAYQTDYATYNNITGMAFPQYLVPISGPPSSSNNMTGVFGSAASLLLNWQPFTFGQRNAQINVAKENYKLSLADENNTLFQLKVNVIATWLNILYADELTKVYEENIQRIQAQLKQINALVKSGIRPGSDTSLFQAELSKGNIDLYNLQLYKKQQQNNLSELTGVTASTIVTDSSLAHRLPSIAIYDSTTINPLLEYSQQQIQVQQANRNVIQKAVLPKLTAWSTAYARGSDIKYDGTVKSTDGFAFSRYNYGIGLQLSIPILQFTYTRLQLQQQDAVIQSYQAQLQQTQQQLQRDSLNAFESMDNAMKVVKETPVQLNAANTAYRSMLSRYNAGLASFADLIQTQYALIKAETDVKQSYLDVWKALLQQAAVKGNVNIFLSQVK